MTAAPVLTARGDAAAPAEGWTRLHAWLDDPADPAWERPAPTAAQLRRDVLVALVVAVAAVLVVALTKSMGMRITEEELWRAYAAVVLMALPLAWRRRYPLLVLVAASALFLGLSYLSPEAAPQLTFQGAYFASVYSAVAWAGDRRMLWLAVAGVLLTMTLWLTITFTMTSALSSLVDPDDAAGPVPPMVAVVVYSVLLNLAFFGLAILVGRASWRQALQRERLARQNEQIRAQGAELARRAVVDERLRIARELHDVVAHHVSVIGIQAAAARRVLGRDPEAAEQALRTVEGASRDAVGEMRGLLGVLRTETGLHEGRAPEPGLPELAELADAHRAAGLDVELSCVATFPFDDVPAPLALSVYRTVQEALTNVVRHSTAGRAIVTVRTGTTDAGDRWVEAEVVDDGRPRAGTSGTGFGLRGIEERVRLHGGDAEIGPRRTGTGWRVRARFAVRGGAR